MSNSIWGQIWGYIGRNDGPQRRQGSQPTGPMSRDSAPPARVNFDTAMSVSAFWACARLLAETLGSLPLQCFTISSDGTSTPNTNYQLWRMLNFRPNRYQTRNEFF